MQNLLSSELLETIKLIMNASAALWIVVSIYLVVSCRGVIKKKNRWIENLHIEQKQNRQDLRLAQDITESLTGEVYQMIQKNAQLSEEIKDLKKYKLQKETFIAELKDEIEQYQKRVSYLKAVKNHKKRPNPDEQKITDKTIFVCKTLAYAGKFTRGLSYVLAQNYNTEKHLLWLTGNDGKSYLVEKSDFKPVQS